MVGHRTIILFAKVSLPYTDTQPVNSINSGIIIKPSEGEQEQQSTDRSILVHKITETDLRTLKSWNSPRSASSTQLTNSQHNNPVLTMNKII